MIDRVFASEAVRDFAGCDISALPFTPFMDRLLARVEAGERNLLVGHHNLHSLYLRHRDPEVARFYAACDDCYVDGVGALWALHAAGLDTQRARRFTLMDCLPELLDLAQVRGLRIYYLGGAPEVVAKGREWIGREWPRLDIRMHHGFMLDPDEASLEIKAFEPDVLLVGMGMPLQEHWILAHGRHVNAGIVLQSGGTLDYYTGFQARPPEALSRIGLAWLYRLLHDPRRLWRRYLLTPFALLGPVLTLKRRLRRGRAEQSER